MNWLNVSNVSNLLTYFLLFSVEEFYIPARRIWIPAAPFSMVDERFDMAKKLTSWDQYYKTDFCHYTTAVKLRLDFDAWFEFVPVTLHYQFEAILILPICRCKYVIVWTHLAPQIMNQNRSISCSMANSVLKYCSQCRVNGDKLFPALHVGHRNAHDDQAVGFDRHSSGQLEGFKWGKLWSSLVKGDEQHCRHKW